MDKVNRADFSQARRRPESEGAIELTKGQSSA